MTGIYTDLECVTGVYTDLDCVIGVFTEFINVGNEVVWMKLSSVFCDRIEIPRSAKPSVIVDVASDANKIVLLPLTLELECIF